MRSLFALLLTLPSILVGQPNSNYPEIPYTTFRTFDIIDQNVIAIGNCDQIWHSYDEGESWTIRDVGFSGSRVSMIKDGDKDKAIVTAFREVYLYSLEEGVLQSFTPDINDLGVTDARHVQTDDQYAYLMANEGILRGEIGEFNWEMVYQDTSDSDFVTTSDITEKHLFLGTGKGRMIKYNLEDQSTELAFQFENRLGSLNMVNDNLGYMTISGESMVYMTTDGWASHSQVEGMPEAISPLGYGEDIVITVNTNRIYKSTDGGLTSTYIETDLSPYFGLVEFAKITDDGVLYLSGKGAMFVKSIDFGETWVYQNPIDRIDYEGSSVLESGVGYVVGNKNIILKTTDHGKTWSKMNTNITGENHGYYSIAQINDEKILAAGNEYYNIIEAGEIVYTGNIGINDVVYNAQKDYLIAAQSNSPGHDIIKSTDQGLTWTTLFNAEDFSYDIHLSPTGRLYVPTSTGDVFVSDDDGDTWSTESMWTESIRHIDFLDNDNGLILSNRSLLKTTDGGQTFEEIGNGYAIRAISFLSPDHILYATSNNDATNLKESTDGGVTWKAVFNNCTTTRHASINSLNQLILSQKTGHVNLVNTATSTNVVDEKAVPLANINPNPFKIGGTLQVDLIWHSLSVFNINGEVCFELNTYSPSIPITKLNQGAYIIQFNTSHGLVTQKLVVIE